MGECGVRRGAALGACKGVLLQSCRGGGVAKIGGREIILDLPVEIGYSIDTQYYGHAEPTVRAVLIVEPHSCLLSIYYFSRSEAIA